MDDNEKTKMGKKNNINNLINENVNNENETNTKKKRNRAKRMKIEIDNRTKRKWKEAQQTNKQTRSAERFEIK